MVNQVKKLSYLSIFLAVTGCSLYSENQAPVFNSVGVKSAVNSQPAIIASTPKTTTQSIENPSTSTPLINASSDNPYQAQSDSVNTASVDATTINLNTSTVPDVTESANNQLVDAEKSVDDLGYSTATLNDPRIEEATDILNRTSSSSVEAVNNINQTVDSATNQVNQVSTQSTSTINQASDRATSAVNQATNTVNSNASAAAEQVDLSKNTINKNITSNTTSATQALLEEAKIAVSAGNLDSAASALERAQRIEPQNPKILYDIAQIRYAQGDYTQAESFASKAAALSSDATLSQKIWNLLGESRQALGQTSAAEAALQKAASFAN